MKVIIYEKNGVCKEFFDQQGPIKTICIVFGIDNMANLSHGVEQVGFSIVINKEDRVLAAAICVPATNTIVYTESDDAAFVLYEEGIPKKLRINQSLNIALPSILYAVGDTKDRVDDLLTGRGSHLVSSGSILCDAVRVVENKIDVAFHPAYEKPEQIIAIRAIIKAAGGAEDVFGKSYVFGKKAIVRPIKAA